MPNAWEAAPIVEGNADAPPAAWQSAPIVDEAAEAPQKSGYAANLAAGANAAIAGTLGLPVDLATGGINLVSRGVNAVAGTHIPAIDHAVGGSDSIKRAMGVVGANPDDVRSDGVGQEIVRGVGGGIVSAVAPEAALSGLVRGGVVAAPTAARFVSALGGATPENALLGAASGGASEAAASQVPDAYKPYAGLAGGLAGVGLPLAAVAGGRAAVRSAGDYLEPIVGRKAPLVVPDANGNAINSLAGGPIVVTPNVARLAGEKIQGAASEPNNLLATLTAPDANVPGFQPTTAQLANDPNLLASERGLTRLPDAQGPTLQRAADQNDALVGAVRQIAPGADPEAVPTLLKARAATDDASAQQQLEATRAQANTSVTQTEAATRAQVEQAQAQATARQTAAETTSQANTARLQQNADQARATIGGDLPAGSEAQVGAALRAPLVAADDAARTQERAAWNAVDPNGKLAVDMTPIRQGGADILNERSPLAAPLAGNEAGIFGSVAGMDDVHSFRDLAALRGRLTDAIRQERMNPAGDQQAVRRMSMLLDHVHTAMETSAAPGAVPAVSANGLTANFDEAAQQRYATARQMTADRKGGFETAPGVKSAMQGGSTSGSFKLADAGVPASIIKVGPSGADHVATYLNKGGDPEALAHAAAFSLRRDAARPDGTIDPDKYLRWAQQRSSFLSALPDAHTRFGAAADAQRALDAGRVAADQSAKEATKLGQQSVKTATGEADQTVKAAVKAAQKTVDDATATQAQAAAARQKSAVGRFLGERDPVTQVAAILRSPTAVPDMRRLSQAVASDPEAKAGLQRAIAEHILDKLKGNAGRAGGVEDALKSDQLQTFIKTNDRALREVLTPEQMESMNKVANGLHQANLSVGGSKLQGGSDTMQIGAKAVNAAPETVLGNIAHQAASHVGSAIGGGVGFVLGGGPIGAIVGASIGKGGDWIVSATRSAHDAGIKSVEDLTAAAMLHPQLAAVLLSRVTPQNRAFIAARLIGQLQRITLVSASVGRADQKTSAPLNQLAH